MNISILVATFLFEVVIFSCALFYGTFGSK